jgi:5-dehydro-2-deoxygluconokinase
MTIASLNTALKDKSFLVIGRVGLDLCPTPEGTRTQDMTTLFADMGGSSANIAAGLVKLGCTAALVTSVSDDAVGWLCENMLDRYGVNRAHVKRVRGEYRTSLAVYESRLEDHQSVIYRNNAADFQMTVQDVEAIDYSKFSALVTAGTVFAAEPSRTAAFRAFDRAREAGIPIIFDVDYRPYSWPSPEVAEDVLSRAGALSDMIVGNDEEFGFMAGSIDKGLSKARDLGSTSARLVVYKMGPEGAITFVNTGTTTPDELRTGIYPAQALKPTGAGDSFMAGLLSSLAGGTSLKDAVLRGSACASYVVARPGCAPAMPTTEQLETFLSDHLGPTTP